MIGILWPWTEVVAFNGDAAAAFAAGIITGIGLMILYLDWSKQREEKKQ